ncbi:hypothetical protein SAMN05421839_11654 [Halolactibacillus halophilus]|uniref:Uncharacterized protein n=2 Tax=Halolactibacillus halophilus TaxID=306540 RepID=A0A1I5PUI5_9BACI|nr:hypothetical protein [Halolactibacillus halophilus]SFP08698.1 hypothetical protein SAMN05421839_10580 [Halolactibacillus halophilus]SFP37286.1 hypothetical protein SAMN05421839_11654 [Halolactibacillus halophilus]
MQEQWYTNKDLFEQINAISGDFKDLRSEMRETRAVIKQYNGLREEVGLVREEIEEVKKQVQESQGINKGKSTVFEAIRNWGGWLFALITLIVMLNQFYN